MTLVGLYTDEEFEADYPVDFGKGIRGEWLGHRKKTAGVVICHRHTGDIGCATSVFWMKVNSQKLYTLVKEEPLTIEEDIRCSCGLHGWIREGKWEHAHDSIL